MPGIDAQAALQVALELQGDVCIRGVGEHTAVAASMDAFSPTPITRNGSAAGSQPDLSMGRQGNRWLGLCVELRHCGQSPSSAAVPVLQQQIDVASAEVVRCSGVTQEGVRGKDFPSAFSLPTLLKRPANGLHGLAIAAVQRQIRAPLP